ncbi:MAG: BspA family leucine-rich repeat surface protein [Bacteroidaceae bacterium]|nr:BspA family leucine-rich repeat surface protein [Bacteroidaceae bacterium]
MRTLRHTLAVLLTALMAVSHAFAQDIAVTVTPTQQVLPPQLMLYITEPGNYFNISISNSGANNENVYLVMQIEQVNPASGLGLSTPTKRQPQMPIVVPAGSTRILTPAEIRSLFNHIPLSEFKAPAGLFDSYTNGSFGLLPEGQYELHFTAYHWDLSGEPYVVSNPTGGMAYFDICYKAQAPQFLTPMATGEEAMNPLTVAEVDPLSPQFTWQAPVIACNPSLIQYNYSLRVVEMLPGQMPDQSMDNNPVVYQMSNLTTPMCMIPQHVVTQMKAGKTYAAQVTATPANSNSRMLNYVSIENKGKSTYKLFRLKATEKVETETPEPKVPDVEEDKDEEKKDEEKKDEDKKEEAENEDKGKKDEDEEDDDISAIMGDVKTSEIVEDSLYTFRNPKIVEPYFHEDNGARKRFVETGLEISWERPQFIGGEGQENDTIRIEYEVQLFNNGERADKEDALKQEPIYTFQTSEQKDTVEWEDIAELAEAGDYMVLRIKPVVVHGSSVAFTGDDNVVDFALVDHLSRQYFQCSSTTEIENKKPTSKEASDFKGKQVSIGEYLMTIDEISGNGADGFKGKGRVLWEPFGSKIMVCVTFDKLKINIDDVVYEGIAVSETAPQMSSNKECVDNLFSEWGLDNLIADTSIPYSNQLQNAATSGVKSLAEQINLSKYYQAIKDGEGLYNLITDGGMDKLYTPIKFPTEVLPKGWDVVDIQIADMKFAPDYATMNIIGQSILPECDVLKSKILVFGAPRVCISPNRFLPESGHIALLGDFTLAPSSNFEMTFKAPKDVMEPKDGCYISWHADTLELLGIDADMKVAGIVKDIDGKPTTERPVINLKASFGSWSDFMVENISIDDFQVEDLPGWTFTAKNIVYDHSIFRNSQHMGKFPERFSKTKAGIKGNDESWQGLHIGEIGIKFPKSLEIGEGSGDEDKRLSVKGEEMFFDNNVTLKMTAENIFSAKEGKMGGWGISLDKAQLQIIQDDFDNCMFAGQLNVPLFGSKEKKKDDKGKEKFGNIDYTCEIRRLTDPRPRSKVTEAINPTDLQKTRYSYVFLTESVDDLNFNCFVAQATLDAKQTYFLIEAYDDEKEDKINTQVELCIGGTIGIGGVDEANAWLKEKTSKLPLEVKIPDIHFTKMRLSNVKRADWVSVSELAANKRKAREARESEVYNELKKNKLYYQIAKSEEMALGESFYLDLGEWSLASAKKRLGPFSFNLDKFKPSFSGSDLKVEVSGSIGLVEDKINVGAGITISAKLDMPGTDISKWSISDGEIKFDTLGLDLDFTALHLKGGLKVIEDGTDKGYRGDLAIDITGLFSLNCNGGYFEHAPDALSKKEMKADGADTDHMDAGDLKYSWGYFMVKMESSTGIRIDPLVINRISGGFFFNCRPTKGKDSKTDKFGGTPEAQYGVIGAALGMTMSTSAGEKTLKADMDLLVCYDKQNKCLSTFMFNGHLEAVGGLINADASLIYENQKAGGTTKNRYLCLNVTVEAGADTKALIAEVTKANAALESLKDKMDQFQGKVDDIANKMTTNPMQGLKQLSGKYDGEKSKEVAANDTEDKDVPSKGKDAEKELGVTAMKTKISLEFKITWVKDGQEYSTPKWHLYLGEPEKDKRCSFTYLKFDGKIVHVDIGADGYICLGNELPNNGALPAIPSKITEFLAGHKVEKTDMGGDLGKAERSRKRATQALLGGDINGGVMVGASAWGYIKIDLGLLYGSLDAIAGFDASLINYGGSAFCVNSGKPMGKDGWYAMGQFYAYLAAELGIHVKIGSFINEKIKIFDAGIGGVLEVGLPNPTWVEGQARIKISLLGGLCKINKKFEFSAGDHCVPFKGNALDGFEMFQDVSLGSDSLYQALMDPTFAISASDAHNMTFTTTSSIGSHYRLLDPSWVDELADRAETTEEDLNERLAQNASRTYVFDMDQNLNKNNMKMGVRLFDLGTDATDWVNSGEKMSESEFYTKMGRKYYSYTYDNMSSLMASLYNERGKTVSETSMVMKGKELSKGEDYLLKGEEKDFIDYYLNISDSWAQKYNIGVKNKSEQDVSFRESKGTTFHLTGMNLQPGHAYAMFLMADAYEIENGKRIWCSYVDDKKGKEHRIHWKQTKAWFFRVKSNEEEKIVTDSLRDLQPYIALAYPSTDGSRVVDTRGEGTVTAYFNDILHPTIALNRDIRTSLPEEKMTWVLSAITQAGDTIRKEQPAKYVVNGNCINLEPKTAFTYFPEFTSAKNSAKSAGKDYDYSTELYHLELKYTYSHGYRSGSGIQRKYKQYKDSTFNLVDLMLTTLPHSVTVKDKTYTDSWKVTTTKDVKEVLPYSFPFVGARIYAQPTIDYEADYSARTNTYDNKGNIKSSTLTRTDEDYVFKNAKYSKFNLPYRLIDPYMYFAYLGKWVFVGDREISPYKFDEVGVKFGSETLIFNYNGTTVNVEFLKDVTNKSMYQVRNQMYNVWNDWSYNNSNMPYYPLPTTAKTVGGLTVNNQDGKTSTVTPLNVNHSKDYTYCFQDLVKDYTAVYDVASELCTKLYHVSTQLTNEFFTQAKAYTSHRDKKKFNNDLNAAIKTLTQANRGKYIEVKKRGYEVRIPWYQMPLIYGDCFGGDAKYGNWDLDKDDRTFSKSIGEGDMKSGDADNVNLKKRWRTEASNLLFFRLNKSAESSYMWDGDPGWPGLIYLRDKNKYNESYQGGTGTSMNVEFDYFRRDKGLEAVSDFRALLYRVDAYDLNTGLYTVKSVGGGPWTEVVQINAENATATNLEEMTSAITAQDEYLRTHYDQPQPQVICTRSDDYYNLYFLYSDSIYTEDKKFDDGKTIWWCWHGREDFENTAWHKAKRNCKTVTFRQSFKDADIRSTRQWFWGFTELTDVYNLRFYLNTANVTDMSGMFYNCPKLKDLYLQDLNTAKVKNLSQMLRGCESLESVNMTGWNTAKVESMFAMFSGCKALTEIEGLDKFDTQKVEKMDLMFSGCSSLSSLTLDNFTSQSLTDVSNMFKKCSSLTKISLNGLEGMKLASTSGMFADCAKLKTLNIKCLTGKDENFTYKSYYDGMFTNVPSTLTSNINYGLVDKIKDQIPGKPSATYDENYKVIYGTATRQNRNVLIFLRNTTQYQKGTSYTISCNGTGREVKVIDFWQGKSVLDTKENSESAIPWVNYKENIQDVYINSTFVQSPSSTSYWFNGFTNLENIYGLTNLNTSRVQSMHSMFRKCAKLKKLDLSKFSTAKLKNMARMFSGCEAIEELGFGYNWKTENVTLMSALFYNCKLLQKLQFVYDFDTKNVTNMSQMFQGCENLEYVDMSFNQEFDTEKVTNMKSMFKDCKRLKRIPSLTSTNSVTSMEEMFYNCESLTELDFTKYDLSKVTNMKNVFGNCKAMTNLNLSTFMGEKLTTYGSMFSGLNTQCTIYIPYDCKKAVLDQCPKSTFPNLVLIYPAYVIRYQVGGNAQLLFLGSKTTLKVGDKYNGYKIDAIWSGTDVMDSRRGGHDWTFDPDYPITKVTIDESFKNVPIVNASYYFSFNKNQCTSITGLQYLNMKNAKDLSWMFSGFQGTSLDLSSLDTSSATDMSFMFYGCPNLTTLKLGSSFKTDNVTNMNAMFMSCKKLSSLNLSSFNTSNVTNMTLMFDGCNGLTSLDLSTFDIRNVKDGYLAGMFGCKSLKTLNLSNFDLSGQTNIALLFGGCENLESLDLSTVDLSNIKDMTGLFSGCSSLRKLVMGSMFTPSNIRKADTSLFGSPFEGVHDLTVVTPPDMLTSIRDCFVEKLGFMEGVTGTFYDKEPDKTAQAIWTADNNTLTFYYGYPVGSYYDGQVVTQKWEGDEVVKSANTPAWNSTVKGKVTKVVFDPSFANVRPTNMRCWFYQCRQLTEIQGMKYLNTSQVTDMNHTFYYCDKLKEIDLSNFNTAKVTDMGYMFGWCTQLTSLDLSKFNTAKVWNLNNMFYDCYRITKLDLSSFNTTNVTQADNMFFQMSAMKTLRLGQNFTFPTMSRKATNCFSYVTKAVVEVNSKYMASVKADVVNKLGFIEKENDTNGEFVEYDKKAAQAIWTKDNSTLTFFYGKQYKVGDTFRNGKTVTNVWSGSDLTSTTDNYGTRKYQSTVKDVMTTVVFDASFAEYHLTTCVGMFKNCSKLRTVTGIQYLNTDKMYCLYGMFYGCSSLTTLDVSKFNTSSAGQMTYMFNGCSNLKNLDVSNWNTSNATQMNSMFYGCSSLTTLATGNWNTGKVTTMSGMFQGCSNLATLDVSKWDTGKVTSMSYMFYNCSKLNNPDVSKWNTINVTTMYGMFQGCSSLTELANNFDTGKVTDMGSMFYNCTSLAYSPCGSWDVSKVTNFSYMFYNCSKVWCFSLSNWKTTSATNMKYMFYNCSGATLINTDNWNTSKVTDMSYMFYKCSKMDADHMNGWDTSKVTDMKYMYYGCANINFFSEDKLKTSSVTDVSYMFYGCSKVTRLDLLLFDATKVKKFDEMFSYCTNLKTLNLGENFYNDIASVSPYMTIIRSILSLEVGLYNVTKGSSRQTSMVNTLKKLGINNPNYQKIYTSYLIQGWGIQMGSKIDY